MDAISEREARKRQNFSRELNERGWYHSFELPDGTRIQGVMSLQHQIERYSRFPIPADLTGKRVLDIGAWDGWFSFEAERRGAQVTAIDCVELPTFLKIHRALRSKVDYRILDFYDLPAAGFGQFDFVFFLGVLYHLKHPLLALEIVSALATEVAVVESFVTDGDTWQDHQDQIPSMEFYEGDELGDQLDNWIGPSVGALMAMSRAAGFARVELLHAKAANAGLACFKRWEPVPSGDLQPAPELLSVMNTRTFGNNFYTRREEYISVWLDTPQAEVAREDVRFEIGGFGVPALWVRHEEDRRWQANFRLPPGLRAGWNEVRLRLANTGFGNCLRVPVDIPAEADELVLTVVCDGVSWTRNEVRTAGEGHLSFWIRGLPENCDRDNIRALLGDERLTVDHIGALDGEGCRQVNAIVPAGIPKGDSQLVIRFGRTASAPVPVKVL